jgi:hypothetical protein
MTLQLCLIALVMSSPSSPSAIIFGTRSTKLVRHFPYAPYIMHIIEQLSDIKFPTNAPHTVLKISYKMSHKARKEMEDAATARASSSRAHAFGPHSHASPPAASRSRHAASEEPPNKFKFFMNYMFGACCASAQCEHDMQERMYHIEYKLDIQSDAPPPLVPLRDLLNSMTRHVWSSMVSLLLVHMARLIYLLKIWQTHLRMRSAMKKVILMTMRLCCMRLCGRVDPSLTRPTLFGT